MSFSVPTLSDVCSTIENGFSSAFYGKSGNLRVGVLKVLSKVVAGGCYLPILFCQYIWKNSFIESADVENLVRFGGWYNLPHKVASPARGDVTFNGTAGVEVPANTYLVESSSGHRYYTTESVIISDRGYGSTNVIAEDVGSEYNLPTNTTLEFEDFDDSDNVTSVVAGNVDSGASYDVTVDGKAEKWGETIEDYRSRLTYRRQHQPMGGAKSDYIQWATRFACVTDAAVIPNFPNTNSVSVALFNIDSENGWVSDEDFATVKAYLTDESRKPITADVNVIQGYATTFGFVITLTKNTESVKSDIESALKTYLRTFKPRDTITTALVERYLNSNGIADCTVDSMSVAGTSTTEYTLGLGNAAAEMVNINKLALEYN